MGAQLDDLTLRLRAEGFEKATRVVAGLTAQVRALKSEMGKSTTAFTGLTRAAKKTTTGMKETGTATQRAGQRTRQLSKDVNAAKVGFLGLNDTLDKTIRKVLLWSISTSVIFGTIRAFRALFGVITEHDTQMTALRKVYSGAESDIAGIKIQVMDTARAMQTLTSEALKAGIVVARTGRVGSEIADLTRTALIAQNIAEIDAADSVKFLNSAVIQFDLTVRESLRVLDEWNELSNRTPATTLDMAQAASFAGSVFHNLSTEIQFLNAMTATLVEVTAKSGNMIGRAERTMAVYSQRLTTVNKLANIGVRVYDQLNGSYRGLDTILTEVATKWKFLSDSNKAATAQAIAGTRQQQFFIALMENQDLLFDNLIIQWESYGSAIQENDLFLESIAKKFDALKNSIESLAIATGDAGLTGIIKHELDLFTALLQSLSTTGGATVTLGAVVASLTIAFTKSAAAGGKFAVAMRFVGRSFLWVAVAQIALEVLNLIVGRFTKAARAAEDFAAENKKAFDATLAHSERLKSMSDTLKDLTNARKKLTESGKDTIDIDKNITKVLRSIQRLYPELNAEMLEVISSQDTWNTSLETTIRLMNDLQKAKLVEQLTEVNVQIAALGGDRTGIDRALGGGGRAGKGKGRLTLTDLTRDPIGPFLTTSAAADASGAALGKPVKEAIEKEESLTAAVARREVIEDRIAVLDGEKVETGEATLSVGELQNLALENQLQILEFINAGASRLEVAVLRENLARELVAATMEGTVQHTRALINLEKQKIALQREGLRLAKAFADPFGRALADSIASGFESDTVTSAMNTLVTSLGSALGAVIEDNVSRSLMASGVGALGQALGGALVGGLVTGVFGLLANTLFPKKEKDQPAELEKEIEDNTKALRELNDTISDLTQLFINAPTGFGLPGGSGFGGSGQGAFGAGASSNIGPQPTISSSGGTTQSISVEINITQQPGQNSKDIANQVQKAVVEIFDKGGNVHQQHGL